MKLVVQLWLLLLLSSRAVHGDIGLELRPDATSYIVADVVELRLYAVSDNSLNQSIAAMDVLLRWDPLVLKLVALHDDGPYQWLSSSFPPDDGLDGLNNQFTDGDAKYTALSGFTVPASATPSGLLVTTFEFRALKPAINATIDLPLTLGNWSSTAVFGTDYPAQNVTGTLAGASITIVPEPSTMGFLILAAGTCVAFRPRRHPSRPLCEP